MKTLLFITFDFPPRRTSAVYRTTGLTRYLAQFGWRTTVLTVEESEGQIEDPLLLAKIPPQIKVVRAHDLRVAAWEDGAARGIQKLGALQPLPHGAQQSWRDRRLRSLGELIRACLYFPDDTVGWVPFGLEKAVELHFRHRFDALYTTSPPRSAPVIGLLFKALFRVPWVAEFRDPWYPPRRPFRPKAERWLLRRVLQAADKVVVISKGHAEDLNRAHGLAHEKLEIISNGYDEDDFRFSDDTRPEWMHPGHFHLSHFGTVYSGFSGSFFPAVAELLRECPAARELLRVHIIGFPDEIVRRYSGDAEFRDVLNLKPFINHSEALRAMRASDGLLVFLGDPQVARLSGLGKIYEYLRSGRPILVIAAEGGTRELVEASGAGWAVAPDDITGIKKALATMLRREGNPSRRATPEFVEQFRYDRLAGRLAKVLEETVHDAR